MVCGFAGARPPSAQNRLRPCRCRTAESVAAPEPVAYEADTCLVRASGQNAPASGLCPLRSRMTCDLCRAG